MQAFKIYIIVRLTSHPHHSLGPVAHLVERLICTEEAGSSNLLWSTYDSRQHASVAGFVVVRPEKIRKTQAGDPLGEKANTWSFRKTLPDIS